MKKILYRIILPAIVLGVVYHFGYSSGRSDGIRTSSAMPEVTSVPVSTPPAPITPQSVTPKVIETSEVSPVPPPTVKRVSSPSVPAPRTNTKTAENKPRVSNTLVQTPEGLVVERRAVVKTKSAGSTLQNVTVNQPASKESKAVFRSPDKASVSVSGTAVVPVSHQTTVLPPLKPLKVQPTSEVPLIAKPSSAPKDPDCGCNKKK
jgi:hypothetical protein